MFHNDQRSVSQLSKSFIESANTWIGVPWVKNGRSRSGVDCVGLVIMCLRNCGIYTRDYPELSSKLGIKPLIEVAKIYGYEVSIQDIFTGDILLMHLPGHTNMKHVAIYDGYSIIHCGMHWNKVVRHRLDEALKRMVKRVFRFKDDLPGVICE